MNNEDAPKFRILQVSTFDFQGGAEKVAWNLFSSYKKLGYPSWLVVGHKHGNEPDVFELRSRNTSNVWLRFWTSISRAAGKYSSRIRGAGRFSKTASRIAEPAKWFDRIRGREDFRYPETWNILEYSESPELIHCHNLHGGYFDLRVLPFLTQQIPVLLTLHDAWLLSGHCSHSFDCERWKIGCGECPDLTIYPSIERDSTAHNWFQKKQIFKSSRFYLSTPSQWLMNKVQQSILVDGIIEARIIPNGVDLSIFSAIDRKMSRNILGLPADADIVLLSAYGTHQWKDFDTIKATVESMSKEVKDRKLLFLVTGEKARTESIGNAQIHFVEHRQESSTVANYYKASDLYVHSSKVDTFPNAVIESLACGTPVIGTAVGGIPEQIKSLSLETFGLTSTELIFKHYHAEEATGVLVHPKDPVAICRIALELLKNKTLLLQLGENASIDANNRFSLNQQVDAYLSWYSQILKKSTTYAIGS